MHYLFQFTILIGISFLAEITSKLMPGKIPGSIYGLVIMFLFLYFRIIKISQIRQTASFLLEIMPIVFIPAGVGIILAGDLLFENIWSILIISSISTMATLAFSGLLTQEVYKYHIKKAKRKLFENLKDEA